MFKGLAMDLNYDILIVDDISENIKVAMNILKEDNYNFSFALDGQKALDILKTKRFDLILLDIMMPELDGFEVCTRIKQNEHLRDIPIIFLTARTDIDSISKAFSLGAVDYITKPFHSDELLARVKNHLELYHAKQILAKNNLDLNVKIKHTEQRMLSELEQTQKEIIYILTEVMESTSDETGRHMKRVASLCRLIATLHKSLNENDAMVIEYASVLHDIGKITINQDTLHKAGRLTHEEFEEIKKHTTNAHELLKNSKRRIIQAGDIIAYQHHEKWNGSGYPRGLKGEDIHIYGRVVAMADVLDALTHKRVYKNSWSFEKAAEYIIEHKGTQFDPYLVELFEDNLEKFKEIIKS
jgi:putative two-component system response regulator